jgi:serine/threonine protein kinase
VSWAHTQPLIPFPVPGSALHSSRGTYVVGQLIGDGQYGSVYDCYGPFDQLYALKMFRPANKPYQVVKDEWSSEMQRLDSYRHPNIVYIYDAFEESFLFYIVLERCDTSLRAMMGAPFSDGLFMEVSRQLLMSIQYLHDKGLVHSDLHAGNVLVSNVQSTPVVKLTDFGVAHQLDGTTWFRPQVANPKILTPELVTAGYTTRQSDLYQLGLLMFQMHTGQPALDFNVPYGDVTRQIAEGTPRMKAESLGTSISQVIAKLLRRRDAYRYHSARQVWEDLRTRVPQLEAHRTNPGTGPYSSPPFRPPQGSNPGTSTPGT